MPPRLAVVGDHPLADPVRARAHAVGLRVAEPGVAEAGNADVAIVLGEHRPSVPAVGAVLRQPAARASELAVPVGGAWGGLGSLLAAMAVSEADDPVELHVAYGFPGATRLLTRLGSTLRGEVLGIATDDAVARVAGERVPEPLGAGRRLAWFPRPVGPAHAVAVGGLEHLAAMPVPTVRTWVAARSLTAELLQALGRLDPATGIGARLAARAARGRAEPGTDDVRWAVVAECLDADGGIVRAWANGTDPMAVTIDVLLVGARRLAESGPPTSGATVADLGDAHAQLDALADLRTLRWSVSRPEPARR